MATYIQGQSGWHTKKADTAPLGQSIPLVETVCGAKMYSGLPQSQTAPQSADHCAACAQGARIFKRRR